MQRVHTVAATTAVIVRTTSNHSRRRLPTLFRPRYWGINYSHPMDMSSNGFVQATSMKQDVPETVRWPARSSDTDILIRETSRLLLTSKEAEQAVDREHAISGSLWTQVVSRFRKTLQADPREIFTEPSEYITFLAHAKRAITSLAPASTIKSESATAMRPNRIDSDFLNLCVEVLGRVARAQFPDALRASVALRDATDLRAPHLWYPLARSFKRRIIFHAGPTNSGKTHSALEALRNAHCGLYCGPLRLLALEVFENLNNTGCPASLMTGQERRFIPFATHVSCTVEMASIDSVVDVAVIDEVQMISDPQRGASWTRVLLGLAAEELHLCGDPAAEPVITAIANVCGDHLEIRRYSRLSQLTVATKSLGGDYSAVEAGDCVVAFSRRDIYAIRRAIERKTAHKCCVVYGSLPPETRSQQARLFNDPNSEYNVLVASDAIGMGLNLNIKRIVFHAVEKFDGTSTGPVQPAQLKQIAGRAGRHRSMYPEGFVTTLADADLPYVKSCWDTPTTPITRAGLFPSSEQLLRLADALPPGHDLGQVVDHFTALSRVDGMYFLCRADELKSTASTIAHIPLPLPLRAKLLLMPVSMRNADVRTYVVNYLEKFAAGIPVRLNVHLPLNDISYLMRDLSALEAKHSVIDLYLWLGNRLNNGFGDNLSNASESTGMMFPDMEAAYALRLEATKMLETALTALSDDTKSTWEAQLVKRRGQRAALTQKASTSWERNANMNNNNNNRGSTSTSIKMNIKMNIGFL